MTDAQGEFSAPGRLPVIFSRMEPDMRSILLYVIGVPIPIILLVALCTHHF
jgi:hypothetical protein